MVRRLVGGLAMANGTDLLRARFGIDVPGAEVPDAIAPLLDRRVVRRYRDEPVSDALLDALLAVAQSAPAKSDLQQYSVVVMRDAARIKQIADWIGTMDWIATAPVFLVWCGDMRRGQRLCDMHGMPHANNNLDTFLNTAVDCSLAMGQFMAAAEAVGLGTCPISYVRSHIERVSPLLRPAVRRLSGGRAERRLAQQRLRARAGCARGRSNEDPASAAWAHGQRQRHEEVSRWRATACHTAAVLFNLDTFLNTAVDCSLAMGQFMAAAEAVGLGTCPISYVRSHIERVSPLLGLPSGVYPVAGLSVGWPVFRRPVSMRLPPSVVVHRERYDDSAMESEVRAYDDRRRAREPVAAAGLKNNDVYPPRDGVGWSENVARQLSVPERFGFAAYLRTKGFELA